MRFGVTLEFELDPALLGAIPDALDRAARVAPERVRDELNKLLGGRHPSDGFEWLRETGLLGLCLPELLEGYGLPQNRWHAYDVYTHILFVVETAPRPTSGSCGWARSSTTSASPARAWGGGGRGDVSTTTRSWAPSMTRQIMGRLRYSGQEIDAVVNLVRNHMFNYLPEWSDAAVRRLIRRVGTEALADLLAIRN